MGEKTSNYGDKESARAFRRASTASENILWQNLRRHSLGIRFRRQHPIGPYILDFFCYKVKLCVELDGDVHKAPLASVKDSIRTSYLNRQHITVLRYSNDVVYRNLDGVIYSIKNYIANPRFMPGWHFNVFIREDGGVVGESALIPSMEESEVCDLP